MAGWGDPPWTLSLEGARREAVRVADGWEHLDSYRQLEQRLTAWALAEKSILAGLVVGSRARAAPPADPWADLDVVFFVPDPGQYTARPDWFASFGPVWARHLEETGTSGPEWFVLFRGGWKLDVVFSPAPAQGGKLADWMRSSPHRVVFQRGFRLILDRTGVEGQPIAFDTAEPPPAIPDAQALQSVLEQSWLTAARGARLIRRGDLWRAKYACDCDLKRLLLKLIEWHALAVGDPGQDIWYDGRSLHDWADPSVAAALPAAFGGYDRAGLARALRATLDLIGRLGAQLAESWGYAYPSDTEDEVLNWLHAHIPPMSPSKLG